MSLTQNTPTAFSRHFGFIDERIGYTVRNTIELFVLFGLCLVSEKCACQRAGLPYQPRRLSWPSDRHLNRQMRGPNGAGTFEGGTTGTWQPVVTGWAMLLIVIAFVTFGYWFVYYSYLPNNAMPAVLLFLLMTAGIIMAKVFVGFRIFLTRWDASVVLFGLLTFMGLVAIQIIINYLVPASTFDTVPGQATVSRFWTMMFYFSAGIAEESFFSLFLLTVFVNMFKFRLGVPFSILLDAALFMMYHSAVINTIYTSQIYQSTPYVIVLFSGGIILRAMYYITKSTAVPMIGHAMLNTFVTALSLGLVTIPGFSGVVPTASQAILVPTMLAIPMISATAFIFLLRKRGPWIQRKWVYMSVSGMIR